MRRLSTQTRSFTASKVKALFRQELPYRYRDTASTLLMPGDRWADV